MLPYSRIARNDDEADRYEAAREEWIAERAAALEVEYKADHAKREKAIAEFMGSSDTTDLDLALRLFLAAYENAKAPNSVAEAASDLAKSLRSYIDPIIEEWARDAAIADWARLEEIEADWKCERRAVA